MKCGYRRQTTYGYNNDACSTASVIRRMLDARIILNEDSLVLCLFESVYRLLAGRDTSVGIASRYGLDSTGIESRWGARFSPPVPGAHPASYAMGTGSFLGVDCMWYIHHHHVQEGLGLIPVPCILKMKLVPPSLPRSSYASSSFWFIL